MSRAHRRIGYAVALCVALLIPAATPALAAPDGVLIIHSNQRPTPAALIIEDTVRKTIDSGVMQPVDVFSEYLDVERFSAPSYVAAATEFLASKYGNRNVRVIIAAAPPAVRFATQLRERMAIDVPIVHIALAKDVVARSPLPPGVIGATVDLDPLPTLQMAMRLQPRARKVVMVTGADERDRVWEQRLRGAAGRLEGAVEVEYLSGLSTAEVLQRVSMLPRDTIVYTPGYFVDGAGHVGSARQSLELIAPASAAPVYGPLDTFLGTGIVGGYMAPYEDQAKRAGSIVVNLLNGVAANAVELSSVPNVPIVDARQIRRWGIDERLLPTGTVVKFREPSAWDRYGAEISAGIAILFMQAGLIALLLLERRSRRRTAGALHESQEQVSLAARAARLSLWIWDVTRDRLAGSATGRPHIAPGSAPAIAFSRVLDTVHPGDREMLDRAVRRALDTSEEFDVEYRQIERDGTLRWIAARGRAEGPEHLLGVALDVTDRKRSEMQAAEDRSALQHMTRVSMLGQLSAAIAHQVNQPLAAILGNAEAAQKMLSRDDVDLEELRAICRDIISEDHRASEVIRRLGELYKRGDLSKTAVDLNDLVRETLDLVRTELVTRQVVAIAELQPEMPQIQGGRVQLQQVLLNLILNAADAMRTTPIEHRRLIIRTESSNDDVRLCVIDHGTGIGDDALRNMFDAFWSSKTGGMGIGLAICRSIIDAHHGKIEATNNSDGGATICVSLPLRLP